MRKMLSAVLAVALLLTSVSAASAVSYSFTVASHRTLVTTVVDTASGTGNCGGIMVHNRSGFAIYVRVDGTDPGVAAEDSLYVADNTSRGFSMPNYQSPSIKLVSVGAAVYSVECQ